MICPICREVISLYDAVMLGRCAHILCQTCWEIFKNSHLTSSNSLRSPKCPSCRSLIHISSVIQKENFRYIISVIEDDIKKENQYLRNRLKELTTFNRQQLGKWKYDYKIYINQCSIVEEREVEKRNLLTDIYNQELIHYNDLHVDFLEVYKKMRNKLSKMTEDYSGGTPGLIPSEQDAPTELFIQIPYHLIRTSQT